VAMVFYKDLIISLSLALYGVFFPKLMYGKIHSNRNLKYSIQFRDMLFLISDGLAAGRSLENAIEYGLMELQLQYPNKEIMIIKEFEIILKKTKMNQTIQSAFQEFEEKFENREISDFVSIYVLSSQKGGNLVNSIKKTIDLITQKISTLEDISVIIAEKVLEVRLLSIVPLVIVLLLNQVAYGYVSVLYESLQGRITMTVSLLLYLVGVFMANKITRFGI
jgi:tight adherence protein B